MSHPLLEKDLLSTCVHCGFCLEVCPTYRLTGDENNSPRGRLRLWREEAAGRLARDPETDFYTSECVGCLACEPVCPAGVAYGDILEQTRHEHVSAGRFHPKPELRLAAQAVRYPILFNAALAPARALRSLGFFPHPLIFPGRPHVTESTAAYARRLMEVHKPTAKRARPSTRWRDQEFTITILRPSWRMLTAMASPSFSSGNRWVMRLSTGRPIPWARRRKL